MAITVDNSLGGPAGTQPSASSLQATARTGTVGIASPGEAVYSAAETIHSLTTTEVATYYHRAGTPRCTVALPPSGPWWARWYVWMPSLELAGLGTNECRWHVAFPDVGLGYVTHATAAGNIGSRLQPTDLAASSIIWDSQGGSSVTTGQWWRVELHYDGTDFTASVYAGHATTGARIHTWLSRDVGRTMEVTGFRYRRNLYLSYGNTTFDQNVQDYQNHLINLGYPAPQFGADGFYGSEMEGQLESFQGDVGLPVGAGQAEGGVGPETLSAVDYGINVQNNTPSPTLYLSHLAVSDSGALGPAAAPAGTASGDLSVLLGTAGYKAGRGDASGTLDLAPSPDGTAAKAGTAAAAVNIDPSGDGQKAGAGTASAATALATTATGHKAAHGTAAAGLTVSTLAEGSTGNRADAALSVAGSTTGHKAGTGTAAASTTLAAAATGHKHAHGTAAATIVVSTVAGQTIEPIPAVTGTATVVGQLTGDVLAVDRLTGTVRPVGRLAGHVERE
ncbi:peptidoglycan-binding domain-containing protein [Nocardiopsis aegyptia]|uniref:peptidoglycan-binding domain-containing protein n=1 Tax=Nocardiopsis aegyptia TaxID=220378 RepID=UPI00367230D9